MKQLKLWHGVVFMIFALWLITQFEIYTLGEVIR